MAQSTSIFVPTSDADILQKYDSESGAGTKKLKLFSQQLPAPTVTSTMDVFDHHYGIIRRGPARMVVTAPSLAEAKRFQGFPDSWILDANSLKGKMVMVVAWRKICLLSTQQTRR